jgi:hypothetical protein
MTPERALGLIAAALATLNRVRKSNGVEPLTRGEFAELDGVILEDGIVTVRDVAVTYSIGHGVVSAKPCHHDWPSRPLLTGAPSPSTLR